MGEKADYLFDDVRFFDPTATGEQSTIGRRYAYDARGRRVAETTFEDGVAETTYFVYDGHRVIEELDGNGNVTASYVYGQYIDEVLQMRRDTDPGAAGMEDHYYLHDDLFNVVGLADASGALRERYEYADYGMPAVYDAANNPLAASAFQNAYLFNGRRFDAATGLYPPAADLRPNAPATWTRTSAGSSPATPSASGATRITWGIPIPMWGITPGRGWIRLGR